MRFPHLLLIALLLTLTACNSNLALPQLPRPLPANPPEAGADAPRTDVPGPPVPSMGAASAGATSTPGGPLAVAATQPAGGVIAAATLPAGTPAPVATRNAAGGLPIATAGVTATATPIANPGQVLQDGRSLQEVGDCDAARRVFASLIDAGRSGTTNIPAGEVSEARYRLAECYLRDNAATEAASVLADLLAAAPADDAYRAPATFLLGEAQADLRLWDDAVASYSRYLGLAPDVAAFTWQRIAGVRKSAGNLLGATEAYSKALTFSPGWSTTVDLRRALAGILLQRKDYAAAVAQYDLLRGGQTAGAWASQMQWQAGSALSLAGNAAGAAERWQASAMADPTTSYAYQAVVALVDAKAPVDDFLRAMVDYHNGAYNPAIQAFDRVRQTDTNGHNGEASYYTGLSYLAMDQNDRAMTELGNFIASYPQSPFWNDAWLARARAQGRAGNRAGAIAALRQFVDQHPNAKQAPAALSQAVAWLVQDGNSPDAAQAYLDLARRYPGAADAWQAYLTAGLSYYRLGDTSHAGQVWSEMAASTALPGWTKPVAYYWLGKAQTAAGETENARRSWQAAVQAAPESYYGMRAADRLSGQGSTIFGPGVSKLPAAADAAVDTGALSAWLSTWAGEGSLALSPAIQADADWRRGRQLLDINLRGPAVAAWTQLQKRYAENPWALASLALAFRAAGEYPLSISSAEMLAGLAPAGKDLPMALGRLEYPLVLMPLIGSQAAQWGVDPFLVAALIRQESRFETVAISSAAAQGLMQIIPSTADWIAKQLGRSDFLDHQIYWPYVNVEFGTYYLHRQLQAFGSVAPALAAYNGGPGNASKWRSRSPDDEDLMVALIDLSESRLYVQLVYQHYD
ncbi:MAG TPA: transglycosylase SLT domain-containing protein, partial [Anaerolineae bacterium]